MKYIKTFESHINLPSREELDNYFLEYLENDSCTKLIRFNDGVFNVTYYLLESEDYGQKPVNFKEIKDRLDANNIKYRNVSDGNFTDEKNGIRISYNGQDITNVLDSYLTGVYLYDQILDINGNVSEYYYKNSNGEIVLNYRIFGNDLRPSVRLFKDIVGDFNIEPTMAYKIITFFVTEYVSKNKNDFPKDFLIKKCMHIF